MVLKIYFGAKFFEQIWNLHWSSTNVWKMTIHIGSMGSSSISDSGDRCERGRDSGKSMTIINGGDNRTRSDSTSKNLSNSVRFRFSLSFSLSKEVATIGTISIGDMEPSSIGDSGNRSERCGQF